MNKLHKKFLLQAGATFSGLSLMASPLQAQEENLQTIGAPKTVKAIGKNPQQKDNGHVTFDVDASRIGNMEYLFSKRIAVIFEGAATPDRPCPYISTQHREPQYTEIGRRVFRVSTAATEHEIETVKKMGCIITDSPPISKILGGKKTGHQPSPE